jgi:hypothetical protein
VSFNIKIDPSGADVRELIDKFSEAGVKRKIMAALRATGVEMSGEAADLLKKRTLSPNRGGGSTGALSRSLGSDVKTKGDGATLRVGSLRTSRGKPLPYAKIRDKGGTIKAKTGGYLAIPIKKFLKEHGRNVVTAAGVVGIGAREIKDSPEQYGFRSTFIVQGKRGPVVMGAPFDQVDPVPIFALRRSVTQRGYDYLTDAMKEAPSAFIEILEQEFAE